MSVIAICNQALTWVGSDPITSFDDGTRESDLCRENYDPLRQAVLEAAEWSFATKRYRLTPTTEVPAFGHGKTYLIPPEVLRVLTCRQDANEDDRFNSLSWTKEGNRILCSVDVIYLRGTINFEDTAKFSPGFRQSLAGRLAAEISPPLTQSKELTKALWQLYELKVDEAMGTEGKVGRSRRVRSSELINARRAGYV